MGSGAWSTNTYNARAAAKAAAGQNTFDYSDRTLRQSRSSWTAHALLDPTQKNRNGAHAGMITREAMDSGEHPESTPIAVLFDVTASMRQVPTVLQSKLPDLHGLLGDGYASDPQLLFGAIGDATCDAVPLQVGQFESDNRMDEQIEHIVLEGGGGGQNHESYELAAYFLARHTYTDAWEQRGRKGFVFLMGDELPYDTVNAGQVQRLIGDGLEADIPTEEIFQELQERYHVFFLFCAEGGYTAQRNLPRWTQLLGDRALVLDDARAVSETIALTVGVVEGTCTLQDGLDTLAAKEVDPAIIASAGRALAALSSQAPAGAVASGALDLTGGGAVTRI